MSSVQFPHSLPLVSVGCITRFAFGVKFPANRELTGKLSRIRCFLGFSLIIAEFYQWLARQFPTQINREFFDGDQGNSFPEQGIDRLLSGIDFGLSKTVDLFLQRPIQRDRFADNLLQGQLSWLRAIQNCALDFRG